MNEEVSIHKSKNLLSAVQVALKTFGEKVTAQHKPDIGAYFLGQGYWWSLALDKDSGILAAMAIKDEWPLRLVLVFVFDTPHDAKEVNAAFEEKGATGFLASITQKVVIDDETKYPNLLGPFRFLIGQMEACAEHRALGSGNN